MGVTHSLEEDQVQRVSAALANSAQAIQGINEKFDLVDEHWRTARELHADMNSRVESALESFIRLDDTFNDRVGKALVTVQGFTDELAKVMDDSALMLREFDVRREVNQVPQAIIPMMIPLMILMIEVSVANAYLGLLMTRLPDFSNHYSTYLFANAFAVLMGLMLSLIWLASYRGWLSYKYRIRSKAVEKALLEEVNEAEELRQETEMDDLEDDAVEVDKTASPGGSSVRNESTAPPVVVLSSSMGQELRLEIARRAARRRATLEESGVPYRVPSSASSPGSPTSARARAMALERRAFGHQDSEVAARFEDPLMISGVLRRRAQAVRESMAATGTSPGESVVGQATGLSRSVSSQSSPHASPALEVANARSQGLLEPPPFMLPAARERSEAPLASSAIAGTVSGVSADQGAPTTGISSSSLPSVESGKKKGKVAYSITGPFQASVTWGGGAGRAARRNRGGEGGAVSPRAGGAEARPRSPTAGGFAGGGRPLRPIEHPMLAPEDQPRRQLSGPVRRPPPLEGEVFGDPPPPEGLRAQVVDDSAETRSVMI